jgi:hypothetical protein
MAAFNGSQQPVCKEATFIRSSAAGVETVDIAPRDWLVA